MKTKSLLIVLSCLLLSLVASADVLTGTAGVSLNAPNGWKQGPNQGGAVLVVYAPAPLPGFHPNINVLKQNTKGMTADQYGATSSQQIKKAGGALQPIVKFTLQDGTVARQTSFTFPSKGKTLGCYSVWVTKGKSTYLYTGTTLQADFKNKKASFEKIAKTLRVPK